VRSLKAISDVPSCSLLVRLILSAVDSLRRVADLPGDTLAALGGRASLTMRRVEACTDRDPGLVTIFSQVQDILQQLEQQQRVRERSYHVKLLAGLASAHQRDGRFLGAHIVYPVRGQFEHPASCLTNPEIVLDIQP